MEIAYSLASEELHPTDMVHAARRAEELNFQSVWLSDHFHPWTDRQGQSPFVWSVIGGIAATTGLRVGTAVTCPPDPHRTPRSSPTPRRRRRRCCRDGSSLGVGTGESAQRARSRRPMATRGRPPRDARGSGRGDAQALGGRRAVARGQALPRRERASVHVARRARRPSWCPGSAPSPPHWRERSATDISAPPPTPICSRRSIRRRGTGKPKLAGIKVCWADDEAVARRTAYELWPNLGLPGQLAQELTSPALFEQAVELVQEEQITSMVPCGPDPERHVETIRRVRGRGLRHCVRPPDRVGPGRLPALLRQGSLAQGMRPQMPDTVSPPLWR